MDTKDENKTLSIGSKIFAFTGIALAGFLSLNSFYSFYRMKIQGDEIKNFNASFFTETSLTWAHLVFGFLFLGGVYIAYLGLNEQKSFNIFASFVYSFALISLFVSYIA